MAEVGEFRSCSLFIVSRSQTRVGLSRLVCWDVGPNSSIFNLMNFTWKSWLRLSWCTNFSCVLTVLVKTFSYQSLFADSPGYYFEYLTSVTSQVIAVLSFCCSCTCSLIALYSASCTTLQSLVVKTSLHSLTMQVPLHVWHWGRLRMSSVKSLLQTGTHWGYNWDSGQLHWWKFWGITFLILNDVSKKYCMYGFAAHQRPPGWVWYRLCKH